MSEAKEFVSNNPLFKSLEPEDVADYQKWARENYVINTPISGVWHPVVQHECALMNEGK